MSELPDPAAGVRHVSLRSGVYADSVRLMQVSREIGGRPGVTAVLVAMATPLNLELAAGMGLAPDGGARPDELLIALRAADDAELAAAVAAVDTALAARETGGGTAQAIPARTIGAALSDLDAGSA
ncbi:MAG: sucD, partial [Modestobacter sp.]|nr:sucD [Modestobacter sp.]